MRIAAAGMIQGAMISIALAAIPVAVQSAPILQITIDKPLVGRAVVSGDVARGTNAVYVLSAAGVNWTYDVTVAVNEVTPGEFIRMTAKARHRIAPHSGEMFPGLPLETESLLVSFIGGIDLTGPRVVQDMLPHPGSDAGHFDFLRTSADDLNGANPGFARRALISARFDVRHATSVPEPASLSLLALGVAGLGMASQRRVQAALGLGRV